MPYLGVVIGIAPALLLAATAGGVFKLAIVVVVFVVANQIEGHLLSPMVLGRTTNLQPVTVIIAILVGLSLMGIVGALLAVPTMAALENCCFRNTTTPAAFTKNSTVARPPPERQTQIGSAALGISPGPPSALRPEAVPLAARPDQAQRPAGCRWDSGPTRVQSEPRAAAGRPSCPADP